MPKAARKKQAVFLPSSSGGASSSRSLMWMMLALFGGLAILLGAALFVASRAVRSIGLSAAGARDSIHTPGGTFRLQKETQVGPGLPVYPRSSLIVPDDQTAAAAIKQAQKGIEVSSYYSTDTRDFVDGWYAKHLSPEFTRHDAGSQPGSSFYSDAHISPNDVVFVAEREQMVRAVALSVDASGTRISLIRFDKATGEGAATPASANSPTPTTEPAPAVTQ